jgi:hypothetical protein
MLSSKNLDIVHHFRCRTLERLPAGRKSQSRRIYTKGLLVDAQCCGYREVLQTREGDASDIKGRLRLFLRRSNVTKLFYDSGQHVDPQAQVAASDRLSYSAVGEWWRKLNSAQLTNNHRKESLIFLAAFLRGHTISFI